MIEVFNNPTLLDILKCVAQMPDDERQQVSALTGHAFSIDGVAIGNYTCPGYKWVAKIGGEPIAVGGFNPQRPNVYRDWMITTPAAFQAHWFPLTRICRRILDDMLNTKIAHRLECVSLASRGIAHKWYKVLGYHNEGIMHGWCANGADAVMFARVKH